MNNDIELQILEALSEFFSLQNDFQVKAMGQENWWEVDKIGDKPVNYTIATIAELAEAIESLDFKWWGSGKEDLVNFGVELIDILHFELSNSMRIMGKRFEEFSIDKLIHIKNPLLNELASGIKEDLDEINKRDKQKDLNKSFDKEEFYELLISFIRYSATLSGKNILTKPLFLEQYVINIRYVFKMLFALGFTVNEIREKYKLKNALNNVRKLNGYKEGVYVKTWLNIHNGIQDEDNKIALNLIKDKNYSFDGMIEVLDNYYKENIKSLND